MNLLCLMLLAAMPPQDTLAPYGPQDTLAPPARLLVIAHDDSWFATQDTNDAVNAAKENHIPVVGTFQSVRVPAARWSDEWLDGLASKDARPGDTLIVFTVGHGAREGFLYGLGARQWVVNRLATMAVRNKQRVLWWQLSCHAGAGLEYYDQQPYEVTQWLTIFCASPAAYVAWSGEEAGLMRRLFARLRERPDMNMEEFQDFLCHNDNRRTCDWLKGWRGQRIFGHRN
ncbi:MAG TPA: hypothetical protein VKS79_21120 [Gemmataceae bacterium]|nr:hypothetical protein [Gemmataceae bacterium]